MSFLYPTALWGLIAVFLPLIIHLFSIRKNQKVEFSSIRHIQALKNESIRKLKILNWIIILLRMLIILFLVIMTSGPIIVNQSSWIPSEKESLAVIIVDNSASMSVTKEGISFFEKTSFEISKIVSSFEGVVNLNVFQTTPPKSIYSGVIEKGEKINIEDWNINQSMGQDKLWTFTDSVLKTFNSNLPNKECFILSDFPIEPMENFKDDFTDWRFYLFGREKLENNLGIKNIKVLNQIKLPNELINISARIDNIGSINRSNVPIELYINGDRSGQIVTEFQPEKNKDFLFQIYSGKSGVIKGKLEIPKDEFSLDNFQTFEMNVPEQIFCKVIASSQEQLLIIKTILESISGSEDLIDIELKVKPEIDNIFLDNTDVLILQDPISFSINSIEKIKNFIHDGGNILWFSGENFEYINEITSETFNLPKYDELITLPDESYFSVRIDDRENPIFQELNLRNLNSVFPKIFIYNKIISDRTHKSILSLDNDDPFLIRIPFSGSNIYFFSSLLDLRWNDFGMKGLLIPMIYRLLMFTVIDEHNTSMIFINDPKTIHIDKNLINNRWMIKSPSGDEILIVPDYENEQLIFNQTFELGSYQVYVDDKFYTAFSTRLSPYESPDLRVEKSRLLDIIGFDKTEWIDSNTDIISTIKAQRHGRTLWRTFLIICLGLFFIESFLSRPRTAALKNITNVK